MTKSRSLPPVLRNRPQSRNHLLGSLPADQYERLSPMLEVVSLSPKQVLHNPGEPSTHVYFPRGGFLSITVVMESGTMVEVATVGREGMAGMSAKWPGRAGSPNTLVCVQGDTDSCYRMLGEDFRREMDTCADFTNMINLYGEAFLGVVMQSTGCNAAHRVEQRLSKWLLMAHDRMESAEFALTQEFVAMMLGATRQTVTVVAGTLQRSGLITYHRGRIQILDRKGLEALSCECYRVSTALLRAVVEPRSKLRPRPKSV